MKYEKRLPNVKINKYVYCCGFHSSPKSLVTFQISWGDSAVC